ncbi:hypothetical protein CSA37_13420 [Candidatus Fermentibacteria bacterium]|nr:MAG: hypothetical protein CSA37_13420 [Candidatus Fermentibacteria bacterium]
MKNTFLLPLTLCLSVNGLASEVFNTTPDWSCPVPGRFSRLKISSVLLNNDSYPDLIVGQTSSERLYVYLGNGDGTFSMNQELPFSRPAWIETSDLDGDSHEEVLVRSIGSSVLAVFFNDLSGILSDPVLSYGMGGASESEAGMFEVTDFNGDGEKDILIPHHTGMIELLEGDGSGSFQACSLYGEYPADLLALDVGDVDADGDLDIAALGQGEIVVLLNNGAGEVEPGGVYGSLPFTGAPGSLGLVDLDLDNDLDIVTAPGACMCYNAIYAFLGDGAGSFTQVDSSWSSDVYPHVNTHDINLDGYPDAFFHGYSGNALLLGDGQGGFCEDYYNGLHDYTWHAAEADFDLDGDIDYAACFRPVSALNLAIYLNKTISSGIEEQPQQPVDASLPVISVLNCPAVSTASVSVSLSEQSFCSITAFDLNGRPIETVQNGVLPSGATEIQWRTDDLPPGCYFLKLETAAGKSATAECIVAN